MRHQQGASYIAILVAIIGFAFMAKLQLRFGDRISMIECWITRLKSS